jgi:hypothetical protein
MKRLYTLIGMCLMSIVLVAAVNAGSKVNAGPNEDSAVRSQESQVQLPEQDGQNEEITVITPRMSWREKVEMHRRVHDRAIAVRNAQMQNAQMSN